jgi:hypothetical protein
MNPNALQPSCPTHQSEELTESVAMVYQTLSRFQDTFYRRVLDVPGVNLADVPLVSQAPAGLRDRFSEEINYYLYPYSFCGAFPGISAAQLSELGIIAQLYAEYLIQLDKIVDGHLEKSSILTRTLVMLSGQRKHVELVCRLDALFPPHSPFWDYHQEYFYEYVDSELREKSRRGLSPYSEEEMRAIASGKVALAKTITAGMAVISGKWEAVDALHRSQDLFAVGYQLYDDVKDWRKDYEHGAYSQLIRRTIEHFGMEAAFAAGQRPCTGEFGRLLHCSRLSQATLLEASNYFESASQEVQVLDCPGWLNTIENNRQNVLRLRADLDELWQRALVRARGGSAGGGEPAADADASRLPARLNDAILQGTAYLQEQEKLGYIEAAHLALLPKRSRRGQIAGCRWGTVFQRALVLEAIWEAKATGVPIDRATFDADLQCLIDLRLHDRRGGWSYFPGIPELPPDCDDLGQVLHVLLSTDSPRIAELCDDAIELALAGQRDDGSIDTWIADPTDPASIIAKRKTQAVWGSSPDIEVMANFLWALRRYDSRRFARAVQIGASFLAGRQDEHGYWSSTWYPGLYYGTWACTRLLAGLGTFPKNVERARQAILDSQQPTGGWGEPAPTALDTAYALMTLRLVERGGTERAVVSRGVRFLLAEQRADGSWSPSPFIKMEPEVAPPVRLPGYHDRWYGSATISTSFATRALLGQRAGLVVGCDQRATATFGAG